MRTSFELRKARFEKIKAGRCVALAGVFAAMMFGSPVLARAALIGPDVIGPDPSLPGIPLDGTKITRTLDVAVVGRILPRCQLGEGGEINFGNLEVPKQITAGLDLKCNVPFSLALRAENGGLTHRQMPKGQGGYSGSLGYDVSISVPVIAHISRTIYEDYSSEELHNGVVISSGNAISNNNATIKFSSRNHSGQGLLAGDYFESVLLTITPIM